MDTLHLTGAVGPGCPNDKKDVTGIQTFLNQAGALTARGLPLAVDGSAGPMTFAAITDFQTQWTPYRDGKVDVHGATVRKLVEIGNEFRLIVATVNGEAANSSTVAQTAILCVMMNRVGKREWARYHTVAAIIQHTGFDAYTQKIAPYTHAFQYMTGRDARKLNPRLETTIKALRPIYQKKKADITCGAQLYYSPKAQAALHKKLPKSYKDVPPWNFSLLQECTVPGLLPTDDFKFFKYK